MRSEMMMVWLSMKSQSKSSAIFVNLGLWKDFMDDRTIIIPDLMQDYDTPEIQKMIDLEFKMYQHHSTHTKGTHDLVRPMLYSIVLQLFRQDPLWYAFQVACCPDNCFQLITYPYVAKGAQPCQKTRFLHMDINIDDFRKHDLGANRHESRSWISQSYG
jgi:hypothetical protein